MSDKLIVVGRHFCYFVTFKCSCTFSPCYVAVVMMIASVLLGLATLRAARTLHIRLIGDVLRLPMVFFDTTPTGRLLNRFSKDVDVLDNTLPFILRGWITTLLQVFFFFFFFFEKCFQHLVNFSRASHFYVVMKKKGLHQKRCLSTRRIHSYIILGNSRKWTSKKMREKMLK